MKVVFSLHGIGLGNNGGSRTVVKCAETLSALGVDAWIFGPNKYTWHKPLGVRFVDGKFPRCDVAIATGYKSVKSTLASTAAKKYYYIRGYELWKASEQQLLDSYKLLKCIVNSEWLQDHLKTLGVNSELVYPGIDKAFRGLGTHRSGAGAIHHKKHKTKRHVDAIKAAKLAGCPLRLLNVDIIDPNDKQLNKWYNQLRVWLAPTELEGLHNPPIEASLAGCALVCTDHPRSGMSDYAINLQTALIYPARNVKAAAACVKELLWNEGLRKKLNNNMVTLLKEKIGSRKRNMLNLLGIIGS